MICPDLFYLDIDHICNPNHSPLQHKRLPFLNKSLNKVEPSAFNLTTCSQFHPQSKSRQIKANYLTFSEISKICLVILSELFLGKLLKVILMKNSNKFPWSSTKGHTINPSDQFLQLKHESLYSWLSKCIMVLHTIEQLW